MLNKIKAKIENGETVTITFVGDSITQGTSHCTDDETYVAIFADCLKKEFPDTTIVRYDGKIQGEMDPLKCYIEVIVQEGNCGRINVLRSGVGGNTV